MGRCRIPQESQTKRSMGNDVHKSGRSDAAAGFYSIGQAADLSGVTAKMIRHYEALGLIRKARRTSSNYRVYSSDDLNTLRFIKRARSLGFSIKEIGDLLDLWQNTRRESRQVKELAMAHIGDLNQKIHEMESMRKALMKLAKSCHGENRPDCPILDDLSQL